MMEMERLRRQVGLELDLERRRQGLNVEELGRRVGTSHVAVRRVLYGREAFTVPTLRTLCRFADALGLRVEIVLRPKTPPCQHCAGTGFIPEPKQRAL